MTPISPGAHGVDRAPKFDKGSVPHGPDDAAAVLRYLGIDEFASMSLKRCGGAFVVKTHQAAVTGDAGCEDGG